MMAPNLSRSILEKPSSSRQEETTPSIEKASMKHRHSTTGDAFAKNTNMDFLGRQGKHMENTVSTLAKDSSLFVITGSPSASQRDFSIPGDATSFGPTSANENGNLDFVCSSKAVKDIFSLPYTVDGGVSVAIHNLNGTLFVDRDPENDEKVPFPHKPPSPTVKHRDRSQENHSTEIGRALVALSSSDPSREGLTVVEAARNAPMNVFAEHDQHFHAKDSVNATQASLGLPRPDDFVYQHIPRSPDPREYLSWKFHDMNFWIGSDALILRSVSSLAVRVEEAKDMKNLLALHQRTVRSGNFQPDHQNTLLQQQGKPSYARAVTKSLEANDGVRDVIGDRNTGFSAPDLRDVKLKTCIVPTVPTVGIPEQDGTSFATERRKETLSGTGNDRPRMLSPVATVLDAYLDNIMANVPQLALCLREKGFIQSVKLLETENIPSGFLTPSAVDMSKKFEVINDEADRVFSPKIMEMNASALLRFLKTNCTKDNATYLLRREAGQANIELYDISAIAAHKQRKWIWWLAMMSYRFAHRLRNFPTTNLDCGTRRNFRQRERSLLENSLDLLETLADMDGNAHESLVAGIRENLADTFLRGDDESGALVTKEMNEPSSPEPATSMSSSQQPYNGVTVDALNKAHDHLSSGIKSLFPKLQKSRGKQGNDSKEEDESPLNVVSIDPEGDSDSDDCQSDGADASEDLQIIANGIQLFGLHVKVVNVLLRLAEIHLRNYYSSSAMQSLRTAARKIADALHILALVSSSDENKSRETEWRRCLQLQFVWLWEHCGHFARSFGSDDLWRDRGHAAADDVLSVLQDSEAAFKEHPFLTHHAEFLDLTMFLSPGPFTLKTRSAVSLSVLDGLTTAGWNGGYSDLEIEPGGVAEARGFLARQRFLQRERRKVIVAACLSYGISIKAYQQLEAKSEETCLDHAFLDLLQQRLGDSCNEVGKILLNELRELLSQRNEEGTSVSNAAANLMLLSSEFWFTEGLSAFQTCDDLQNLVLLRCNLCQCFKLRANAIFAGSGSSDGPSHAEVCLQKAATQLEAAHVALGERHIDSTLWDMVSTELAATFLVLGVRRRQTLIGSGNTPMILQALRLSPGQERSIVEPVERALCIYEGECRNHHQAAAAHYQLALFYSKVWTCQRDEQKTREKLSAAFAHFNAAHSYFRRVVQGNEVTLTLLCLDLSNLYSSVQGEEGLAKALLCCLDTIPAFENYATTTGLSSPSQNEEWRSQMETVAISVEDRVFKLLRNLVKLSDEGLANLAYKDIYRAGLAAKLKASATDDTSNRVRTLRGILVDIRNAYSSCTSQK